MKDWQNVKIWVWKTFIRQSITTIPIRNLITRLDLKFKVTNFIFLSKILNKIDLDLEKIENDQSDEIIEARSPLSRLRPNSANRLNKSKQKFIIQSDS